MNSRVPMKDSFIFLLTSLVERIEKQQVEIEELKTRIENCETDKKIG